MASIQNTAFCTKCGIKHPRPVGNRCKRTFNISAPIIATDQQEHSDSSDTPSLNDMRKASPGQATTNKNSKLDDKLDLILKKMQDLEEKNELLERKINQQDPIVASWGF